MLDRRRVEEISSRMEFGKIHRDTLWQCDFLSKPMRAAKEPLDVYPRVFLHLCSRRVWISASTVQPDSAWVSFKARNFLMGAEDMGLTPEYILRDNDAKFSDQFDEVLKFSGSIVKRNTPLSPDYPKEENKILRARLPKHIATTAD